MGETPLFYALGKIKQGNDKIRMVKLLLESEQVQVGIVNQDKKTCYEAYNDQFGLDEAASLVEKRHLKGESKLGPRASKLFFDDLRGSQREVIFDKKTSKENKQ